MEYKRLVWCYSCRRHFALKAWRVVSKEEFSKIRRSPNYTVTVGLCGECKKLLLSKGARGGSAKADTAILLRQFHWECHLDEAWKVYDAFNVSTFSTREAAMDFAFWLKGERPNEEVVVEQKTMWRMIFRKSKNAEGNEGGEIK